jgi:hypothetical protein
MAHMQHHLWPRGLLRHETCRRPLGEVTARDNWPHARPQPCGLSQPCGDRSLLATNRTSLCVLHRVRCCAGTSQHYNSFSAATIRAWPNLCHAHRRLAPDAAGRRVIPLRDSGYGQALLTEWGYRNFDRASNQQVWRVGLRRTAEAVEQRRIARIRASWPSQVTGLSVPVAPRGLFSSLPDVIGRCSRRRRGGRRRR